VTAACAAAAPVKAAPLQATLVKASCFDDRNWQGIRKYGKRKLGFV
jgi:hypothetical protein